MLARANMHLKAVQCGMLFFFCLLLFLPQVSIAGARNGLTLWFNRVIPSLLPFLILSSLFLSTGLSDRLARFLAPLLSPLLKCSASGCYAVIIGIVAGLPVGAATLCSLVEDGKISPEEGAYLLPMCNHVGPLFCLGFLPECVPSLRSYTLPFYGLIVLSPIITGRVLRKRVYPASPCTLAPSYENPRKRTRAFSFALLDEATGQSFTALVRIGGYIILFSVVSSALSLLPLQPLKAALITGILEITTGAVAVTAASTSAVTVVPLITGLVTFGGLCSLAQTKSVLSGSSIQSAHYILVKIIAASLSIILMRAFLALFA